MLTIKHRIAVLSCKGGVGKSVISAGIALNLARKGYETCLLDLDIHGPSIPKILGLRGKHVGATEEGEIIPVRVNDKLSVLSLEFFLERPELPIIWRGPLKAATILRILAQTKWSCRDFIVIDLPPGTGDEALSVVQYIPKPTSAIIVTTPSSLSEAIVQKALIFCNRTGLNVLGVVENMSYFKCPTCGSIHYLFGKNGGERLAKQFKSKLLGKIPLDLALSKAIDEEKFKEYISSDAKAARAMENIVEQMLDALSGEESSEKSS